MEQKFKTRIKIGDTVYIRKGKDIGKSGKVDKIYRGKNRVLVTGINLVKRHLKPRNKQAGGIITVERPIFLANIQIICPSCNKRTRIRYEGSQQNKQRICIKCGAPISNSTKEYKK